MTEDILWLFQNPVIKRISNCVCFSMANPFAGFFRGAYSHDHVQEAIYNSKETDKEAVNDIHIWWGDHGHHFGVEFVDGAVLTQHGRGGPIRAYNTEVAIAMGLDYYPNYKRVKDFHLPLRTETDPEKVSLLEGAVNNPEKYGALISIFRDESKNHFNMYDRFKDKLYYLYRCFILSRFCPYGSRFPSLDVNFKNVKLSIGDNHGKKSVSYNKPVETS